MPHLFYKAIGSFRSNAAPSITTNIKHIAQTSWAKDYGNNSVSNVLFSSFSQKYGLVGIEMQSISQTLG